MGALLSACSSNGSVSDAPQTVSPTDTGSSTPSPTPSFITVEGFVTANYIADENNCKKAWMPADPSDPLAYVHQIFYEDAANAVEGAKLEVRGASGAVVAEASSASSAKLYPMEDKGPQTDVCLAASPYSVQLPTQEDSYVFSIKKISGAPPAVTPDELSSLNLRCDLQLNGRDSAWIEGPDLCNNIDGL